MYSRLFLTILPTLLCTIAPTLALPVQSSGSFSVEARSFDLSSDNTPLISREFDTELLVERGYQEDESDVLARTITPHEIIQAHHHAEALSKAAYAHHNAARLRGEDVRIDDHILRTHNGQTGRRHVAFRNERQGLPINRHQLLPRQLAVTISKTGRGNHLFSRQLAVTVPKTHQGNSVDRMLKGAARA